MIWPILEARAEICQKKVHFLEDLKTPKFNSEINWPLKVIIGSHLPRIFAYDNEILVRFVPILGTTHSFLIDFTSHLTITPSPPPLKMWVESRENSRASIGRECQCPSEYWFSPFQILTLPDSSPLAKNLSLVCGHLRHVIGRFFWFPASFRDHTEDPFVPGKFSSI